MFTHYYFKKYKVMHNIIVYNNIIYKTQIYIIHAHTHTYIFM